MGIDNSEIAIDKETEDRRDWIDDGNELNWEHEVQCSTKYKGFWPAASSQAMELI